MNVLNFKLLISIQIGQFRGHGKLSANGGKGHSSGGGGAGQQSSIFNNHLKTKFARDNTMIIHVQLRCNQSFRFTEVFFIHIFRKENFFLQW
jgi:hypothetical protein